MFLKSVGNMKSYSFEMRAVQLDLARQMETLDFIKRFTTFIAANGYNTLVLYLEGRIRTDSFAYPAKEESYSAGEMAEVVADAASKGIEVIPVIGTLGHAELFLKHPQLHHPSHTRGELKARYGGQEHDTFCPSQPGTYEFLRKYLAEIAAIFPASYLHAGCDEAWNMVCCDLCRARLAKGESQGDIFAAHLREIHHIITGELGKRVMIWDDMFEYYPNALESIPRDVVMACWQYEGRVEKTKAHFFNRATADALATYDRMGFDYLICPAEFTLHNTESFSAYGAKHRPLGGLLTTWEKGDSFMLQRMPLIASVGRAWRDGVAGDFSSVTKKVVEDLFGVEDNVLFRGIEAICNRGLYLELRTSVGAFLTRRENNANYSGAALVEVLLAALPGYLEKVKPSSRDILEEIILSLRSERVGGRLDELLPKFFKGEGEAGELKARLDEIRGELEAIGRERVAMWHRVRPGIVPCKMEGIYRDYLANLREVPALAAERGALTVHFLLPDQYSAQQVRVLVRYADNPAWEEVGKGVFKELRSFDCFYSRIFLIDKERIPAGVKIETWGFGGQGFTFFEAQNSTGWYIPSGVTHVVGTVADAENLLSHDWKWAFAGERDTARAYFDDALATGMHGFEVDLRKAEENG
jgi:hypothetical protein